MSAATAHAESESTNELPRITALPQREPFDCEREAGARRWAPEAQALIEVVTERYQRKRLSCGCQTRRISLGSGGRLVILREGSPGEPPPLPLLTTVEAFRADNWHDPDALKLLASMSVGAEAELPGVGGAYCLTELNPVQSWILWEVRKTEGIFGLISVGAGKTIAGILAPLAVANCKTAVILAKPDQRLHYRKAYLQLREHFRVPTIVFDDGDVRGSFWVPDMPVLHFVPYTKLSSTKASDYLENLNPDVIIADECHLLGNRSATRTMRFSRFMQHHNGIRFLCWSGSLQNKSLKDSSHLAAHSLGLGSPYPIRDAEVQAWADCIDPSPVPDTYSGKAKALRRAFGSRKVEDDVEAEGVKSLPGFVDVDDLRRGHRRRVITTPGVVSTKSSSVSCSLTINERKSPPIPRTILDDLAQIRNDCLRPDGEELVEQTEIAMCARSVGAGYHYYWAFIHGEPIELIDEWYEARKAWNKELRAKLLNSEAHMDSPRLCATAAERAWQEPRYVGELPVWPAKSWPAWAKIADKVKPDPRVKWIDDYLARDAAEWAKNNVGIVWCQASAFGKRVAQLAGVSYHGGGVDAEAKILAEDGKKSIVASIRAHGESRDGLQHKFSKQLIAEIPSSGKSWEQLLGRLARQGQQADTVESEVYMHVAENRDAFRKAIMYAEFIEATTPNRQLLLCADIGFEV